MKTCFFAKCHYPYLLLLKMKNPSSLLYIQIFGQKHGDSLQIIEVRNKFTEQIVLIKQISLRHPKTCLLYMGTSNGIQWVLKISSAEKTRERDNQYLQESFKEFKESSLYQPAVSSLIHTPPTLIVTYLYNITVHTEFGKLTLNAGLGTVFFSAWYVPFYSVL